MNTETTQELLDKGWKKIQGWMHCHHIYDDMVAQANSGACFVEIGAWKGKSTYFMAALLAGSGKHIRFDVVDTFEGGQEKGQLADEDRKAGRLLEAFTKNVEPVREWIGDVHVMRSDEAVDLYEDNSLDFIFVDGDHTFEGVRSDIVKWWPKLKMGGVMAGDDYNKRSVRRAVHYCLPYVVSSMYPRRAENHEDLKAVLCWYMGKDQVSDQDIQNAIGSLG